MSPLLYMTITRSVGLQCMHTLAENAAMDNDGQALQRKHNIISPFSPHRCTHARCELSLHTLQRTSVCVLVTSMSPAKYDCSNRSRCFCYALRYTKELFTRWRPGSPNREGALERGVYWTPVGERGRIQSSHPLDANNGKLQGLTPRRCGLSLPLLQQAVNLSSLTALVLGRIACIT